MPTLIKNPAALATADLPTDLSGAVAAVFRIFDAWGLSPEEGQRLLGVAPRTYFAWRKQPPVHPDRDKLERMSYVLGIWKASRELFPSDGAYRRWPRLPNSAPLFGGRTPLEVMTAGQVADLYRVRAWLDGWRG